MLPSVTQPSAAYVSLQYLVCGHLQGNLRDTVLVTYAVPHAETRKNLTYRIVGAPGPSSFGPGGAFEDKFKESRKDRSSSPPPPPPRQTLMLALSKHAKPTLGGPRPGTPASKV